MTIRRLSRIMALLAALSLLPMGLAEEALSGAIDAPVYETPEFDLAPSGGADEGDWAVMAAEPGVPAEPAIQTDPAPANPVPAVAVSSLKLTKKLTLSLNNARQLVPKLTPADATEALTWSSSDPEVVSVDGSGMIAGLAVGKARITATAQNGASASCKVTVKEVRVKALNFAQLYVTLHPGDSFQTAARLTPADASDQAIDYASSDPAVATVDATGAVTAVGCGTATITAVARGNGKAKNTCKVCVIEADAQRMAGLVIGINPGHQITTVTRLYPIAPGSHQTAKGVKTGACGKWTRVNEYETNLQIGLKLMDLLTEAGATVVITRTSNDVNLTNIQRAKLLNAANVDVALQLHCNSIKNRKAEGCIGYIRTTGDWVAESRALSKALTKAMSKATGCVNQGTKVYNYYMSLNWTTTPSVLLEMGYLSNKKEDRLLASDSYRQKMAEGIMEGLCAYFGR